MIKVDLAFTNEELDIILKALNNSDIGREYRYADGWYINEKREKVEEIAYQIDTYLESIGYKEED